MFAFASRLTCQQSSMFTYSYPASFMPDFTTASAMLLIMSSLTLQPNLFQEFQPMGGVTARFADGDVISCADDAQAKIDPKRQHVATAGLMFMRNVVSERRGPLVGEHVR